MPKIIHINFESQMALPTGFQSLLALIYYKCFTPTGLVVFTDVEYNNHAIPDGVY